MTEEFTGANHSLVKESHDVARQGIQRNVKASTGIMREIMADVADIPEAPLDPVPLGLADWETAAGDPEAEVVTTILEVVVTMPAAAEELVVSGIEDEIGIEDEVVGRRGPEADTEPEAGPPAPPALGGGGTAAEGLARAPTPQGTASPEPGWVGLGAGVVSPDADAIVKRVVQVLLGDNGEVN